MNLDSLPPALLSPPPVALVSPEYNLTTAAPGLHSQNPVRLAFGPLASPLRLDPRRLRTQSDTVPSS